MTKYTKVTMSPVPDQLRWDTPAREQGQSEQVAYAWWPPRRYPADRGYDGHPDTWPEFRRVTTPWSTTVERIVREP